LHGGAAQRGDVVEVLGARIVALVEFPQPGGGGEPP